MKCIVYSKTINEWLTLKFNGIIYYKNMIVNTKIFLYTSFLKEKQRVKNV